MKVLYRLHRSGYLAYMVGGAVRDILLGRRPKDFDVVTDARPKEIRRLFRNSRIIGRRFQLVHVLFRDEVVEVSTFRASPEPPEVPEHWQDEGEEAGGETADEAADEAAVEAADEATPVATEEETEFGTPSADAWRRDFTVNALLYDIATFSVIDYVGGLEDLERRVLRSIGPAERRFAEDPVRMMRVLEYSVRLGFELEATTAAALEQCSRLITQASPARLTYELMEGLRSGHAEGIWAAWEAAGIVARAFPEAAGSHGLGPILAGIDRRHANRERLPDATVLGSLFLPQAVAVLEEALPPQGRLNKQLLLDRLDEILKPAASRMLLSSRTVHLMRHGLFTLGRLRRPPERGRQVNRMTRQDYFRVGWDLFNLAAEAGLLPAESGRAWSRVLAPAEADPAEQVEPEATGDPAVRPRRRRRRRPRARKAT